MMRVVVFNREDARKKNKGAAAARVTFNGGEKVTEIPRGMSAVTTSFE